MTLATTQPTPTGRRGRTVRDVVRGLVSLLALLVFLAGTPLALLTISPVALRVPAWGEVVSVLTRPDDGTVFLTVLTVVAWVCWAILTFSVLAETVAQLRGLPAVHLPGFGGVQRLAGVLVAAVMVMIAPAAAAMDLAHANAIVASAPAAPGSVATTKPATQASGSVGDRQAPDESAAGGEGPTVTVYSGDTLWSLAERHLGDGARFSEIAELNYGRPQLDGAHLVDDHWLRPGWTLLLPADAINLPGRTGTYTVRPGDTLTGIAADKLDDPGRFDEVFTLNAGRTQLDGASLNDPDEIRPGWTLELPAADPKPDASRVEPVPQTVQGKGSTATAGPGQPSSSPAPRDLPSQSAGASPPTIGSPSPAQGSQPPYDEADDGLAEDDRAPIGALLAGLGGLAAAGIIREVGIRRRRTQSRRRPGERLPAVSAAVAETDRVLRAHQQPITLEVLQTSLRALLRTCRETGRPMPRIGAIVLDPERIDLHLTEPYDADGAGLAPYRAVGSRRWRLDDLPNALARREGLDDDEITDPCPALVTVGTTGEALVMVNLEAAGTLGLTGDAKHVEAAMRALAIELVTSPLTQNTEIGLGAELADLAAVIDVVRARTVPEPAKAASQGSAHRHAVSAVWVADGAIDILDARTRGVAPDTWAPRIDLASADETALPDAAAWTGHSVIRAAGSTATTPWVLDLDADGAARLDPLGLLLTPQQLDHEQYRSVLELLGPTDPVPERAQSISPARSPEPDKTDPPVTTARAASDEPLHAAVPAVPVPLGTSVEVGESWPTHESSPFDGHRLAVLGALPIYESLLAAQDQPEHPSEPVVNRKPAVQLVERPTDDVPAGPPKVVVCAPRVLLLGSVEVLGVNDAAAPGRRKRLTELVAYLVMHPGASTHAVDEAMWPGSRVSTDTRNAAVTRTRRWLGKASDDGEYLEHYSEAKGYRLHPDITSDWHDFIALARKGMEAGDRGVEDLTAALALVRGRPFFGIDPRDYSWAEPNIQEMISTITDIALAVTDFRHRAGEHEAAQAAATRGLAVIPDSEALWQAAMRAAHQRGDAREEQRLRIRRHVQLAAGDVV